MKNELLQEAKISSAVLDIVNAVILVMNKDGHIVLFNKASEKLTGYKFEEVKGKCPWDLFILPEDIDGVRNVFSRLTSGDFPNTHINYWLTKNGGKKLIDWSNTVIADKNGRIDFVIATGIDITEKKAAESEIEKYINNLEDEVSKRTSELVASNDKLKVLAIRDGLTGIYNRRHFNEVILKEVERAKRTSESLSLLLCDIDYFKNYNDTYGHLGGDQCLIQIATTLNKYFSRVTDLVARYGGEEFAVILSNVDSENALKLAKNLIAEVQNNNLPHKSSLIGNIVTISVGVTTMQPKELTNSKSLIHAADKALYLAKEKGRNRAEQYLTTNEVKK